LVPRFTRGMGCSLFLVAAFSRERVSAPRRLIAAASEKPAV
jgi:hypothetical protein